MFGHCSRCVKMTRLLCLLLLVPAALAANYVQPCAIDDYACIGNILALNSKCNKQVYGVIPKNYTIATFPFYTPFFNSTYIDSNLTVTNHSSCGVTKFFFNLDDDNSVLSLRCRDLGFYSTRTLIQHYPEQEDTFYSYDYSGVYPEIILTANLRPSYAINICNAEIFTYVTELPLFTVTPNDQATKNFLTTDLTFLKIFERETFFYRGNELFRYFVDAMLCNFSCDF